MSKQRQIKENFIASIIDSADSIMVYIDSAGLVILSNKKIEEMIGSSRSEILGKHWFDVFSQKFDKPMKYQMLKAMIDDSMKYRRPNNFQSAMLDCQGSEHFISWNITPIFNESKNLDGVFLLGNDVTLFKEREASFKNIDDTLKNIFSSIKEYALYAINLDGNITYYGMGSEFLFGWPKDKIIFKPVSVLHNYDDVAYKLPFILEQTRKHGQYELETFLIKKDGQSFPVILTVSQLLDTGGNLTGFIFMAKDMTERKKMEYQIFQSEKLAAVGQLVAGIAHEINNPVFVISGRAQLLLSKKPLSKSLKSDLQAINNQADRIRKLVDRFLSFTRKMPPKPELLDINKVINNVLPFLVYHKLPEYSHHVKIKKSFDKKLPHILGDQHQLQEVFINLFINAYQAMHKGGFLTIKTEKLDDQFIGICISDTGSGISEQNMKNIFMPFFTTKRAGTGLGLSICYNIIKGHNGTIDIESELGKGTVFTIKLPFVKKERKNGK